MPVLLSLELSVDPTLSSCFAVYFEYRLLLKLVGSMYHGSPLLLSILGPLTASSVSWCKIEGHPDHLLCSLFLLLVDIINALLIRATGRCIQDAYGRTLKSLDLVKPSEASEIILSGDLAALVYLWNPFTIVACIGLSTSPVENMAIIVSLYGACTGLVPLAAFGWVIATHMSLYPAVLIVPVILLLGYGPDAPPSKVFLQKKHKKSNAQVIFSWKQPVHFLFWSIMWGMHVLLLCGISVRQYGGLWEMLRRTYGFILTVEDLSPNIGVLWYFFAEVFDFFRSFFLIVFHMNILFMVLPLAIRLKHRPAFLAFVYVAIVAIFKSYPSVGDSALYLGLLALFANELADMKFSFFLFCGYIGVSLLSPVMHNLWIWRGTGNANFYFGTAMAYACFQIILVVESVSSMLDHDRMLVKFVAERNHVATKC
ncbi:hypothetical protein SAY86_023569 [Trapa natans]|uniref:Phosphatidylinositol glycan anchor biosynthesis class U protein n=1 Tax=Trapa natans TaxID=22666 RepID=A0AAN7LVZ3_TRANT|nr:hypothetical protein SAY86_023569 [Trapa natans]